MGRFLSGLSWSQPVASKAHALGMDLGDVQALVLVLRLGLSLKMCMT